MTRQEFERMTAVIDEWLREATVRREIAGSDYNYPAMSIRAAAEAYETAAADILAALPVPEE